MTEIKTLETEYFDLTYSDEPASNYILLLEINQRTLKACWYHKSKNLITGFANYPFAQKDISESIQKIVQDHSYLVSDFDQYLISIITTNYQCNPTGLGIESQNLVFELSNNFDLSIQTLNRYELIGERMQVQYSYPSETLRAIEKYFPKHSLIPHIAPRIEHAKLKLKKSIAENLVLAHIDDNSIDIIAFKERKLQLCNSFFQTGKEDIAYYILYCVEVLGIDPEMVELKLSGSIGIGDEKWNVLNAYWKRLTIESPLEQIDISDKLHARSSSEFDYLTQTLLCE